MKTEMIVSPMSEDYAWTLVNVIRDPEYAKYPSTRTIVTENLISVLATIRQAIPIRNSHVLQDEQWMELPTVDVPTAKKPSDSQPRLCIDSSTSNKLRPRDWKAWARFEKELEYMYSLPEVTYYAQSIMQPMARSPTQNTFTTETTTLGGPDDSPTRHISHMQV